jgi:hypothetical protein
MGAVQRPYAAEDLKSDSVDESIPSCPSSPVSYESDYDPDTTATNSVFPLDLPTCKRPFEEPKEELISLDVPRVTSSSGSKRQAADDCDRPQKKKKKKRGDGDGFQEDVRRTRKRGLQDTTDAQDTLHYNTRSKARRH